MTGYHIYGFFRGAPLNLQTSSIDLKTFFEARVAWFVLFFLTYKSLLKQIGDFGRPSPQVCFLLIAHFLYVNACSRSEELIAPTWDKAYERFVLSVKLLLSYTTKQFFPSITIIPASVTGLLLIRHFSLLLVVYSCTARRPASVNK